MKKNNEEEKWVIMQKEYYINHIVLNGHLNNPVYKPITSNTGQKNFQNLINKLISTPQILLRKGRNMF